MKQLSSIFILLAIMLTDCKKQRPGYLASLTTTPVTNITSNSAETGGTITDAGNLPLSHQGVCFAIHPAPTIQDSIAYAGFGNPSFTVKLNNLDANTTYYIRAYEDNEAGTGYGNELSFTTLKGPPTVITTEISNNQSLQAETGGNVTNDGGAPITATVVCWSLNPHPTLADSSVVNSVSGTGLFVDTIRSLIPLATYYVRAYATNSYGTAYGNEVILIVSTIGTVTDNDGNIYPTVTLGTQTWMTVNLKVTHYQNGDSIINGLTGFNWADSAVGAYTFPNGDTVNNSGYGKLYNVYAINDPRNIAPSGWHVATDSDWQVLEFYEGMAAPDTGAAGTRGTIGGKLLRGGSSGLDLINPGILDPSAGTFLYFTSEGYYWTSTKSSSGPNWFRAFNTIGGDPGPIDRDYNNWVQSVRCVKN